MMADLLIPVQNTLAIIWRVGVWGVGITLTVLWIWELSASHRQAKAERNLQDWSEESMLSSRNHLDLATAELASPTKLNSDILSRLTPRAAYRRGN